MSEPSVPAPLAGLDPQTARLTLGAFVFTFIAARVLVLLIMLQWVPTLYLHVKGTHVHHLNYGIFLLAFVGGYLLFRQPKGRDRTLIAILYGIGLALTFDEFGMWVHLGGPYWQRASFDAVVVIAAVLALIAYAPLLRRFERRHWIASILLVIAIGVFAVVLTKSMREFARERISPVLQQIEASSPQ